MDSLQIGSLKILQGRIPSKSNEVCIEKSANESLKNPYSLGDTIQIKLKNRTTKLKVVGFVSEFMFSGNYIFFSNRFLDTYYEEKKLNFVQVLVDDYYDDDKVSTLVMEIVKNIEGISSENIIWNDSKVNLYNERGSYQSISLSIKSLNIVILLCGIIFLCGEMYNMYLFRKNTYKIMRCLGLSVKKMIVLLLKEFLVLGSVGMLVGFGTGILLNKLVVSKILKYFFSSASYSQYSPDINNVFLCVGIIIGIILLSICILYIYLRNTQPIDTGEYTQMERYHRKSKTIFANNNHSVLNMYIFKRSKLNNLFSILQFLIIAVSFFLSVVAFTVVNGYHKQDSTLDQEFPLQVTVGADGNCMFLNSEEIVEIGKIDSVAEMGAEYSGADLYADVAGKKIKAVIYSDSLMKKINISEKV